MAIKIHWVNLARQEMQRDASARGFYRSVEGRFDISPRYRSTIYPDSFVMKDRIKGDELSSDSIRDLQARALIRVSEEIADEQS